MLYQLEYRLRKSSKLNTVSPETALSTLTFDQQHHTQPKGHRLLNVE